MEKCYVFHYVLSQKDYTEAIPDEVLDRIERRFIEGVEAEGVYAGGAIHEHTWVDAVTDWISRWCNG